MKDGNNIEYEQIRCVSCGIKFFVEKEIRDLWKDESVSFHCPNGHGLKWKPEEKINFKAEFQAAQKEIEALKAQGKHLQEELEIWRPSDYNVFKFNAKTTVTE